MKSDQAKARHAATLRLRAEELRRKANRIGAWLPSVDLPVHELVEEAKRSARALEGAALAVLGTLDHVDDVARYMDELGGAAAELPPHEIAAGGRHNEED